MKYQTISSLLFRSIIGFLILCGGTDVVTANDHFAGVGAPTQNPSLPAGSPASLKQLTFRELASTTSPQLDWPAFPRIWIERGIADYHQTNTGLGFAISGVGGRVALDYKYQLKTTLVIISTARRVDENMRTLASTNPERDLVLGPNEIDERSFEILRVDPKTLYSYANVESGRPVVGFCAYEASFSEETAGSIGLDFFNSGGRYTNGHLESVGQTLFSNFFQLSPTVSVDSYLRQTCATVFRNSIAKHVEADFSRLLVEFMAHRSGKSSCQPDADQKTALASGDRSCQKWFSNLDRSVRWLTVPRCLLNSAGYFDCHLRARAPSNCPMYWDKDRKQFSDDYADRRAVGVTDQFLEFPCDDKQGYKCQLEAEPWWIFGVPMNNARASCKKMS